MSFQSIRCIRAEVRRPRSSLMLRLKMLLVAAACSALLPSSVYAAVVVDDFADGVADGWSPADIPGVTETYAVTGQAYRLEAAANFNPGNPPRAASNRLGPGEVYGDFTMAVDVVDFNATTGNVFGLFARQSDIGLGTTDGYILAYNVSTTTFFIDRIQNEAPVSTLASAILTLNPSNDYRFVFEGSGSTLTGTLYALPNLADPIAQISGIDATYASGRPGLFVFDFSGTGSAGAGATFDNVAFGDPAADTDSDGLYDGFEIAYSLDPSVGGQQTGDPDFDGLDNLAEQAAFTNPNNADTDGDGLLDGTEIAIGSDPLDDTSACPPGYAPDPSGSFCVSSVIVDDFADGFADGWSEVDIPGVTETYAVTGQAYRLEAAANLDFTNPPRAASNRLGPGEVYGDFTMAVDVVDFNATTGNVFGLFARQNEIGPGTTDGYVLGYNFSTTTFFIEIVQDEFAFPIASASAILSLNPSNDYRFVFEGSGSTLTGTLYALPNLADPIAQISGIDATYASGRPGLFVFDLSEFAFAGAGATFDNVAFGDPAVDTDSDGLYDGFEIAYGLNPVLGGQEFGDPDVDGLDNLAEQAAFTNPNLADSDGDLVLDGAEVAAGSDPNDIADSTVATAADDLGVVDQDAPATLINVLLNDDDPDGTPVFTIDFVTQPANGTVVIDVDGLGLTYEPDPGYSNDGLTTDDFTYTLTPGGSTATVSMTVLGLGDYRTVLGASADGVGNLLDISFDVSGQAVTLTADELQGSTLILSTLSPANPDGTRFWTPGLGEPAPTEAEALRVVGDKYLGTAVQTCFSTSQHDAMFDEPITPSSGPEIFIIRGDGGLVGEFTVLDAEGNPGITLPNSVGEAVSIALQSQFLTWPLTNNVNFAVSGGFPSFGTQDRILALDITEGAMASIGGLRFGTIGDSGCDYVYEILAVKPAAPPAVPALGGLGLLALAGAMLYAGTRRTNARG